MYSAARPRQTTGRLIGRVGQAIRHSLLPEEDTRTASERMADGASRRNRVPRSSHAEWLPAPDRPDPVDLLRSSGEARVQELLPLRYERMSASAFTFFRGTALIMASDLAHTPSTGLDVQACGDAHISNFGLFSSPERRTVFDINDFDETSRGPWEWDVKRLATSVEICGRDRGFKEKDRTDAVLACVKGYREAMADFACMGEMDVWYAHLDVDDLLARFSEHGEWDASDKDARGKAGPRGKASTKAKVSTGEQAGSGGKANASVKASTKAKGKPNKSVAKSAKFAAETVAKAKAKNSARAVTKLTEVVDGQLRIVSDPPVVVPLRDMAARAGRADFIDGAYMEKLISLALVEYRRTLSPDKRRLVERYRGVDMAQKVVGVGSVGTRAFIVVMQGAAKDDHLVLQIKEAQESVLEPYCGRSAAREHGQRVVEGQRAMQTASDMLLGWCRLPSVGGGFKDYYVRQLWDGKGSIDLATISKRQLRTLAKACGRTLAHAHARTGDRFAIAGYLGSSDKFDRAIASFAAAYADQNESDYARFMQALAADEL